MQKYNSFLMAPSIGLILMLLALYTVLFPSPKWWVEYKREKCVILKGEFYVRRGTNMFNAGKIINTYCSIPDKKHDYEPY